MTDDASVSAEATSTDDIEELKRQNAELQRQLDEAQSSGGWRMAVAGVLVVLFAIVLVPANQAVWLARTMLNTDSFVATFGPLPKDDAVSTALGAQVAAIVSEEVMVQQRIEGAVGSDLAFIAAPIASAVEGLIAESSSAIISSDIFTSVWEGTLRVTHSAAIAVIDASRDGPAQVTEEGQVVLDLNDLVRQVDDELTARGIDVVDSENVDATIVLYESGELGVVQSIISIVYAIRWAAPLLVLVLLVGAIWVANDRRRVLSWIGTGTIIAGLISLVIVRFLRNDVVDRIQDETQREGAESAWSIVFDQLTGQTWGLIMLGLLAVLGAWFFGPSERAVGLRSSFISARNEAYADQEPTGTTRFFQQYGRIIQWVVIGLGVLFLLVVPVLYGWLVIVTAVVVIALVFGIEWISGSPQQSESDEEPEGEGEADDSPQPETADV
ncbi:MAG: hypothetical protein QNJ71_08435 [Acidimicrobiia bacterium]|nr:hypothetical protein [Acidimicrobiia bacterium]